MMLHPLARKRSPRRIVVRAGLLVMKTAPFLPFPLCCQTRAAATVSIPFHVSMGWQTMLDGEYHLSRVAAPIDTPARQGKGECTSLAYRKIPDVSAVVVPPSSDTERP